MKRLALGCLGVAFVAAVMIAVVGYWLFRELPVLDASRSAPSTVQLDSTFTVVVTATNSHAEPIVLDSIDVYDSFSRGFQVIKVQPEPSETSHLFNFRSWDFGLTVPPGESAEIRFTMKAVQEGNFSGNVDVCNSNMDFSTALADVVVCKEINAGNVAHPAVKSLGFDAKMANTKATTPTDELLIVFQATRDGKAESFAIEVDGANERRPAEALPSRGPKIFRSDTDGQLYVEKANGTLSAPMNSVPDCVSLSPDGATIAFQSRNERPYPLVIMNFDGSRSETIVKAMWTYTPVFSPDGSKIAFMGNDGDFEIYVVNTDGTNLERLTNERGRDGGLSQGAWSPDGSMITFMSERDGRPRQVYVMGADGTNQTRLATGLSPVFVNSHDGTYRASNPLFRVVGSTTDAVGPASQAVAENQTPAEALQKLGGRFTEDVNGNLTRLYLSGNRVTDAAMEHVKWMTNLTQLQLHFTQVSNAGLVHLKEMTNLTSLSLLQTQVTDAGLVHLKGLTNLTSVSLAGTQITDAGLEHLERLTNLTELQLQRTRVSDAGLEHLKGLANLTNVGLSQTRVSDAGLEHF